MPTPTDDAQDAEHYRVYLLRLWRDGTGPWHAALQAADAPTPYRFADLEALILFLRDLVRPPLPTAPAPAQAAPADRDADGCLKAPWADETRPRPT